MSKIYLSKIICKALRHKPEMLDLQLDKRGWVLVDDLVKGLKENGFRFVDREKIEYIVNTNAKHRFELSEDGSKIRATYGHTIPIDLDLNVANVPDILYHGTNTENFKKIVEHGYIESMQRNFVHLADNVNLAKINGKRHGGDLVILKVNAKEMKKDGYIFYKAHSEIYLTKNVPIHYVVNLEEHKNK